MIHSYSNVQIHKVAAVHICFLPVQRNISLQIYFYFNSLLINTLRVIVHVRWLNFMPLNLFDANITDFILPKQQLLLSLFYISL